MTHATRIEQARSIGRKLSDPFWRLCNLFWIKPKLGPNVLFTPTPEQTDLFFNLWYRSLVLKARQLGFSTLIDLVMADKAMFNANFTGGIVDRSLDDAKKKLAIVKRAWENLDNPNGPDGGAMGRLIKSRIELTTDSKTVLAWSNGSTIYAATSVRGGTHQMLHISELGYVAAHFPERAEEIISGGLPSLSQDCIVVSESTHEGGPFGVHASLVKRAMALVGKPISKLDFKFHWYPWHDSLEYRLTEGVLEPELMEYFDRTLPDIGIRLDDDQKRFYSAQYRTMKHRVKTEYPSTPDEALSALSAGSIYGDIISLLRVRGRVREYEYDPSHPCFAFWDIGCSDSTVIWFIQIAGKDINVVDWLEDSGKPCGFYVGECAKRDALYHKVRYHYLPHDADNRDRGNALTYRQQLEQAGLQNIVIVPRTPDVWIGVNEARVLLPNCWFHKRTDETRTKDNIEYPSGLACLELYRREVDIASGKLNEHPIHDFSSHSCDAFRTFAEAWKRGLVQQYLVGGTPGKHKPARAIMPDDRQRDDDFAEFDQ